MKHSFCSNSRCDLKGDCKLYENYRKSLDVEDNGEVLSFAVNDLQTECEFNNYAHFEDKNGDKE